MSSDGANRSNRPPTQEQVKTTDDLVASWKPLAIAELGPLPEEAIAKAEEKLEQQTQE